MDIKGKGFTVRTISHRNNLPREAVDTTLDTFKTQNDRVLGGHLSRLWFCQEKLDQVTLEIPYNPIFYGSVILSWYDIGGGCKKEYQTKLDH